MNNSEFDERIAKQRLKRTLQESAKNMIPLPKQVQNAIKQLFVADENVEFVLVMRRQADPENISISAHGTSENLMMILQFAGQQMAGNHLAAMAQIHAHEAHARGEARN